MSYLVLTAAAVVFAIVWRRTGALEVWQTAGNLARIALAGLRDRTSTDSEKERLARQASISFFRLAVRSLAGFSLAAAAALVLPTLFIFLRLTETQSLNHIFFSWAGIGFMLTGSILPLMWPRQ